RNSLS
ncbi:hypothetical protein D018_3903B, partial [Vibrio parahaemolyticus VP2007-007]